MSPAGRAQARAFQSGRRSADRVTNARDFECTKRVHDRVHDVVEIACMAGGTRVAMHTCTEAVTAHVVLRHTLSARVHCARGPGGVAPASNSARPLGRVKGALRRSLVTFVAPLTRPARSQLRWLLPERRRSLSLHLDLNAEFHHALRR